MRKMKLLLILIPMLLSCEKEDVGINLQADCRVIKQGTYQIDTPGQVEPRVIGPVDLPIRVNYYNVETNTRAWTDLFTETSSVGIFFEEIDINHGNLIRRYTLIDKNEHNTCN